MQVMGVTGKIYGLKVSQTASGKDKVTFRVAVRKQFVTDEDKQNNTTHYFLPMMAVGPTATFISKYFKDGDMISIGSMEYQTYRTKNADPNSKFDDAHVFKVNTVGFVGDGNGSGNGNANRAANRQSNYGNTPPQRPTKNTAPDPFSNEDYSYVANDDDLPF